MTASFSIIIPAYNRPIKLAQCLESLAQLDYPADALEVVVVDDGSERPLAGAVESYKDRLDVRLVRQANQGPAAARNFGVSQARHDFIAFTDDDCRPAPDWLRQFADQLARDPECLVGGHTVNLLLDDTFAEASQLILDVVYDYYNADPESARFFSNNNFALSKSLYEELGGLDVRFRASEDRDFCERWLDSGRRMVYLSNALIHHSHHLSLKQYCLQHFRYGKGAFEFRNTRQVSQTTHEQGDLGIHLDPRYWFRALARRPGWWMRIKLSFALFVWRLADTFGYVYARFTGKTA